MKALDLSKFKKLRTESDHTVLQHPHGHEIKVLHAPLSPKVKEQLDALPHMSKGYAEGGEAIKKENYSNPKLEQSHVVNKVTPGHKKAQRPDPYYADGGQAQPSSGAQSVQDSMRKAFNFADGGGIPISNAANISKGIAGGFGDTKPAPNPQPVKYAKGGAVNHFHFYAEGGAPVSVADESPAAAFTQGLAQNQPDIVQAPAGTVEAVDRNPEVPQEQPPLAPIDPNAPPIGTLPEQAVANVEQANQAEMKGAKNTQVAQSKESDIYGNQAKRQQDLRDDYDEIGSRLHQQFEDTASQVAAGKIDPNQWWDSKGAGSKILTAIGMLFSGAGMGVAGHPEMAGKAIDEAIERNIDAQKTNLNNKNSLLGRYMEMYKSLPEAEAAARLTMNAAVEGKIKQVAAKLGGQNAALTAQQAISQRRQDLLPHMEGLAKSQLSLNTIGGMGGSQSGDPAATIRKYGMAGLMSPQQQEQAQKELGSVSRINKMQQDVEEAARGLDGQLLKGTLTPSARQSSINTFAGILAKEAEGRFNLEEAKTQMKALMPSPLDSKDTSMLKAKHREQFFESLKVAPTLQTYGINPNGNSQPRIAVNRQTGERVIEQNGKWVPYGGK